MTVTQTFDGVFTVSAGTRSQSVDLVLRQDKKFGLVVVDLAKDPFAAGSLAGPVPEIQILTRHYCTSLV
jgi:hypothetical protein